LKTKLYGPEGQVDYKATECDFNTTISSKFNNYIFESFIFEADNLTDGEYYIAFETSTQPKISSTVSFTWPISEEESALQNDDDDEPALISPLLVNGSWSATTNQLGTCWLLKSPEEGIITLSETTSVESWSPRVGAFGLYLMTESDPAPECSDFATKSYMVNEVYTEDMPVTSEDKENKTAVVTTEKTLESEISPVVVTAGAVIAGGGILSLLFAVISTNESLRIPATSAGLWFLGLIGRTSETSDGRYQRGRLMGYLTANPGCHFRALMAALEMSNGQITHHLKVLEDEDSIWRRPDGRLVRFYPYTSNLHPGISEDELPLPPLSPDPNSLQGKILRLLDDDGGMRKYPTQAELAHRLDRSQQLVSHHLRTLQKFGLVQKQKMGIKNRYALTKEAIFLLDTTEV
jgi:DNA-binding MarR family transcriptional regulator